MSSKQLALAYSALGRPLGKDELAIRLEHATQHLQESFEPQLVVRTSISDSTGIISWDVAEPTCSWPQFSTDDSIGSAVWLHVPTIAGAPVDGVDATKTAFAVNNGKIGAPDLGAPFASISIDKSGVLRIANDVFGMARIYRFDFDGLTIWSTRSGLAHVFAGEQPKVNTAAWQSMATPGWSARGLSHMGDGRQLPPHSLTTARPYSMPKVESKLDRWLTNANSEPRAELSQSADDMRRSLETVKHWKRRPVADLSGGKDSRVIAAAGIRANALQAVRTVSLDPPMRVVGSSRA